MAMVQAKVFASSRRASVSFTSMTVKATRGEAGMKNAYFAATATHRPVNT